MRSLRVLAIVTIAGLLAAGILVDRSPRPRSESTSRNVSALAAVTTDVTTWFCPGGSGDGGLAELTVMLANASEQPRTAHVTVVGDGITAPPSTVAIDVEPRGRVLFQPSQQIPDAAWVGAVVEVAGSDVVVEQLLAAAQGDVGRSPCSTRTATGWVVSNGATRAAVERERFVVMLLNPFPDVAVVDLEFVADVGRDSVEGLVVPAQRVVAVEVTDEITVAATVAAFVSAVSGRVAASWIQVSDGQIAGRGARAAAAVPTVAPQWHVPVAATGPGRRDVLAVSNPSTDTAEVDVEVLGAQPDLDVNPIEITVRPGRTALVDLSQQARLGGLSDFSLLVRSLEGVPVTASITSVTSDALVVQGDALPAVEGATATIGADAAARRWLVAAETGPAAAAGEGSSLVIVNPSQVSIVQVDLRVGGRLIRTVELAAGRIRRLPLAELGTDRFVVAVEAAAPVIVGRELVGLTSRTAALGVAVSESVPLTGIR